jgi:hypothetical protein
MFARALTAPNLPVRLVMPVVTRDSALSVRWLTGGQGRETHNSLGTVGEPSEASHSAA